MDTAITVIQVLLSLIAGGGLLKLTLPYAKYVKLPAQGWANDFKPQHVRLIGVLELSAGVGLIVSLLLNSTLAPLAAVGIALVMAGAMATHFRRAEYLIMVGNVAWLGLALFVAFGRLVGFAD